jgi:hypothetical protein
MGRGRASRRRRSAHVARAGIRAARPGVRSPRPAPQTAAPAMSVSRGAASRISSGGNALDPLARVPPGPCPRDPGRGARLPA